MKQAATSEGLLTKHALHVTESMHVTYSRNRRRHMRSGGGLALADVVHGVGQLKGAGALWRAEDVAPLIADVADDDEPSVLQLLPLAGLVGHSRALEAGLLQQQVHPPGDPLAAEVGDGDGPLVLGPAGEEHWLDTDRAQLVVQPLRLRQRGRAPLPHVCVEARRVERCSSAHVCVYEDRLMADSTISASVVLYAYQFKKKGNYGNRSM